VAKRTGMKLFETAKMSRIFAIAASPRVLGLDAFAQVRRDLVVLEDVAMLGNAGAIVRSSLAFGAGGLVLLNVDPVDVFDRRLIRASRGLVFSLPIATATTAELVDLSSRLKLPIAVTAAQATTPVHALQAVSQRLAIVFGSETRGCSQTLVDAATLRVKIPIDPSVDSLNVSAAAGITLYNRLRFNRPDLWSRADADDAR
jgi:tRNA G18 (ribose-2'-O)-methylase SpoU